MSAELSTDGIDWVICLSEHSGEANKAHRQLQALLDDRDKWKQVASQLRQAIEEAKHALLMSGQGHLVSASVSKEIDDAIDRTLYAIDAYDLAKQGDKHE